MSEGRSRLILISVAVADSIWLFALFSMVGLMFDMGGSPLPWLSLLLLMGISILAGHVLAGTRGDEVSIAIWQSLFALIVIYLVLGTGAFIEGPGFNAGWVFKLFGGDGGPSAIPGAIFAFVICVWIWRHGLSLSTDRYPEDRLARIFKVGIAVLAFAILIDQANSADLGIGLLLVPFFGATLVGLAIGRLPEGGMDQGAGQWARIIGVSVFGIMGVGLIIGLVGGLYGNGGVRLLFAGWTLFVDGMVWLLRFPVTGLILFLQWLVDLLRRDSEPVAEPVQVGESGQDMLGVEPNGASETGSAAVESVVNILQYPVIVIVVIVAFFALAMAYRRFGRRDSDDGDDERESLKDELDTSGDMSRLLGGLIPSWWRRNQAKNWRYPDDPGFAEVFKLYFESIAMGVKWGMTYNPHMTPVERLPMLEAALPGAPVREVTDRFNAACYGMVPTNALRVDELRLQLTTAERALRNR